mmetsp:Transcript_548/g.1196  ORF Transcript_548/g.1196 Transcript_548/m.1196 type:complete len:88 (-) Transcript_548:372-635(-)
MLFILCLNNSKIQYILHCSSKTNNCVQQILTATHGLFKRPFIAFHPGGEVEGDARPDTLSSLGGKNDITFGGTQSPLRPFPNASSWC